MIETAWREGDPERCPGRPKARDRLRSRVTALLLAIAVSLEIYCPFGRSSAGFAAKKLNGRIWNSCHIVGITGQSSTRGT